MYYYYYYYYYFTWYSLVVFEQAIQEVFVAEKWVRDAQNDAWVEANLCVEANKALGTFEQKNKELTSKLVVEERVRLSAKVGLKNAQDQAEDQRKKLYHTEIELPTQKQLVLELKADLKKVKEAARTTKEAAKASEQASYERRVQETEIQLADELAEVCRDYCKEVQVEALNQAGALTTSEWRLTKNIFFVEDIREVLAVSILLLFLPFPP